MREEKTLSHALDNILGDFDPTETANTAEPTEHVTFWIPASHKAAFDRLQKVSKRRFGKKVKEAIKTLIELAEKRAS